MTPPRPVVILAPLAVALGLSLVGDAGARASLPVSAPGSVAITAHPSNPTAATAASFGLTSSGTCTLDGGAYAPCGIQVTYTGLRAGTHTFSVRSGAGANSKVSSYSWTVDTTAPSAPTGLSATPGQRVALSWLAASDPDSTIAYVIYRDGARIGQTSSTSYLDSTVAASTTYRYTVMSYDPAGNTSVASSAVTVSTANTPRPLGVPGSWTIKFDDEFSGTSLDTSKWQPNWLGSSSTSVTPPPNSADLNCADPAQVSEGAGVLNLTAVGRWCRASNGRTYNYASGLVNTYSAYRFTYGYAEARIYIPAGASGAPANFPAFWTDGTGTWPATGEMDVMEGLGDCGPGLGYHFHSSLGAFGGCAAMPLSTGWHTFGADWHSGVVTYYYDGTQVGQLTQGITSSPMYLILDNCVDPTYGAATVVPADLKVDYVRVWQ